MLRLVFSPVTLVKSFIKRVVPPPVLVKAYMTARYTPRDLLDLFSGQTDPLVPPRRKIFIGGPEFRAVGEEFFGYFRRYGEIAPEHRILDIGCGIGRMSRPLVAFLDPARGRYEGFDIDGGGIAWCREHYRTYPHFRFQRADIRNKHYHPRGTVSAEAYTFPYADGVFDFAFATSVFTHMPPVAVARYLHETARVLRSGARALLTAFLWNDESEALVAQGKSRIPFSEHEGLIVRNPRVPEEAIAIRQPEWEQALRAAGLVQVGDVLWGSWCGRTQQASFQDIVIVHRPG